MDKKTDDKQRRPYDRTSFILVVDDDNTLLKFFKIHLNKFFSKVIVVKNAKEALETLKEKSIDLVISDIRMPRIDGLALMKRVRKFDQSIPFLVISGALLSDEQRRICEEDADGYLRKPFNVDALHSFIDSGMTRREKLIALAEALKDKAMIRPLLADPKQLSAKHTEGDIEDVGKIIEDLQQRILPEAS